MCFDSVLINHKIAYDAVMKKTLLPPLSLFCRVRGALPPISGVPAYRYQQSLSRCVRSTCQDVCFQQSHAAKCLISQLEVKRRFVALLLLHNKDQQ